jgi:hypothetical protein
LKIELHSDQPHHGKHAEEKHPQSGAEYGLLPPEEQERGAGRQQKQVAKPHEQPRARCVDSMRAEPGPKRSFVGEEGQQDQRKTEDPPGNPGVIGRIS